MAREGLAATVVPRVLVRALGDLKGTKVLPLIDPVVSKLRCRRCNRAVFAADESHRAILRVPLSRRLVRCSVRKERPHSIRPLVLVIRHECCNFQHRRTVS